MRDKHSHRETLVYPQSSLLSIPHYKSSIKYQAPVCHLFTESNLLVLLVLSKNEQYPGPLPIPINK